MKRENMCDKFTKNLIMINEDQPTLPLLVIDAILVPRYSHSFFFLLFI
jgi:hypothetical protein